MNDVKTLMEIDWGTIIPAIFAIIVGFLAIREIILKFFDAVGYVLPQKREKEEMKKAITSLNNEIIQFKNEHNQIINKITEDQIEVINTLEHIKESVAELKDRQNKSDRSRLKDRISQLFRQYKENGEWTLIEKETFDDLVETFRETGEHNTFVNEICYPQSQEFKIID